MIQVRREWLKTLSYFVKFFIQSVEHYSVLKSMLQDYYPKARNCCMAISISFMSPLAFAAIPTGSFDDAVWTHDPKSGALGQHSVSSAAYIFSDELFELPVQASGWGYCQAGAKICSAENAAGKYWAYGDLEKAELTADSQYWTLRISVAGDYEWVGDKNSPESPAGLKGKYYVYFGQENSSEHWVFSIDDASGLSSSFDDSKIKLYQESSDNNKSPPYGTAITTTGESDYQGYNNEIDTSDLEVRTLYDSANDVFDIEIRYDFANGPISQTAMENLDYMRIGVALSNPSSTAVLFANDHFGPTGATSAEYDTLYIVTDPTAVTIGKVELQWTTISELFLQLGFASLSDRELLALLRSWGANISEATIGSNRSALTSALVDYIDMDGDGQVALFRWDTLQERGTIGFFVDRMTVGGGAPIRINDKMLPGLIAAPMGGEYMLFDRTAIPGVQYYYTLVEQEARGAQNSYGPFLLQ